MQALRVAVTDTEKQRSCREPAMYMTSHCADTLTSTESAVKGLGSGTPAAVALNSGTPARCTSLAA